MVFGLGFFIFVMHYIFRDSYRRRDDLYMEAREFGFDGSRLQKEALAYKPRTK